MKAVIRADFKYCSQAICGKPPLDFVRQAVLDAGFDAIIIDCAHDFQPIADDTYMVIPADAPLICAKTLMQLARFCDLQTDRAYAVGDIVLAASGAFFQRNGLDFSAEAYVTVAPADPCELIRIDSPAGYAKAVAAMRERINGIHMEHGVFITDPARTDIDTDVCIGAGTVIYPGCLIENGTVIGQNCTIGPQTMLSAAQVGDNTYIAYSVVSRARIGAEAHIGPFAYIRPDAVIGDGCRIGDFVEIKNSVIGDNTKISHLTYVGDSDVGERVNFGCGTVTVNYDGRAKHRTIIGNDAFIGCNTNLVAPVSLGAGAFTAAGSTITSDVPDNALAIARARQNNKLDWVSKRKI